MSSGPCNWGVSEESAGPGDDLRHTTPEIRGRTYIVPSCTWCWAHRVWVIDGVLCPEGGEEAP